MQNETKKGEGVMSLQMFALLIEHLVHKLLTIITRFLVSF